MMGHKTGVDFFNRNTPFLRSHESKKSGFNVTFIFVIDS